MAKQACFRRSVHRRRRHGIRKCVAVPPTRATDLSLINATEFLDRFEGEDSAREQADAKPRSRGTYADAFDVLESGLELDARAVEALRQHEPAPDTTGPDVAETRLTPADTLVPLKAVAFVVIACLTLGGATATLILHDRVMQITASWTASR